jgi:TetR/AcrR family transcriptional regulator
MTTARLPAEERRASVLFAACDLFSRGSFRGTTTAEIAREAGVTEPVLYRHFASKRDLYLACLDESWRRVQALWDDRLAAEPDPRLWLSVIGRAFIESEAERPLVAPMWVQALAEASEDDEIARYMREHMREVHAYVAGVIRRSQSKDGISSEKDPDAEAWVFIALGLLAMADEVLEGLMHESWPAIRSGRLAWLAPSLHGR